MGGVPPTVDQPVAMTHMSMKTPSPSITTPNARFVAPNSQSFADALWNWNAAHLTTGYYDGEIQLLSMVVASGNWWSPIA